tara:strand:- start:470 stop:1306 length:837 start_codon:yes stop_codon:yes gene_type:complete
MSQIRADNITNRQGTGAPIFVNGIRVVGLTSIANIVANTGTFNGAVSIGGTLTYEDVTNIDAVGLITARSGIRVSSGGINVAGGIDISTGSISLADGARVRFGGDQDLQVYHTGSNAFYENTTGNVYFRNDGSATYFQLGTANDDAIALSKDGPVILYYDSSLKFQTTSGGVKVTGGYSENIVAVSGTEVDCATGSYFTKTITGATTFTFANVPSGVAYAFTFEVTLNGSNAITWPSSVKWPADTAPTITDGKTQVFVFLTDDGGTRWRGSSLVDYTN